MTLTPLETIAFVITLVNVWLTIRENVWCWPTGIVSVILYAIVYWQARYYSSAGLQIVFFTLSVYGWYEWLRGGAGHTELHVTRLQRRHIPLVLLAGIALTTAIGFAGRAAGAMLPFYDAAIAGFSIVAQWMMARKKLENWAMWIGVNIIAVGVYSAGRLYLTAVLYLILLALAFRGWVEWRRSMEHRMAL